MAVNKVVFGTETLIDLTGDTVAPEVLLAGYTATNAAGEAIAGAAVIPTKTSELENDSGYLTEQDISGKLDKTGGTMTGTLFFYLDDGAVYINGQNFTTAYNASSMSSFLKSDNTRLCMLDFNLGYLELQKGTMQALTICRYDSNAGGALISAAPKNYDAKQPLMIAAKKVTFSNGLGSKDAIVVTGIATPIANYDAANKKYVDDTVSAHSGNTTIHVTADEKSAWNAKANATELAKKQNKVTYGTTDLTAGSSALATGELYFVYE